MSMTSPEYDRLMRIFATMLTPMIVGGCGTTIDESQFSFDVCGPGSVGALASVTPEPATDYVEFRKIRSGLSEEPPEITVVSQVGELCATATDSEACTAAFAALPTDSELSEWAFDFVSYYQFAHTRGDTVDVVRSRAELESFLGSIDSPGDAAMLARFSGHDLNCGAGPEVGEHDEGWVVYTTSGSGCGPEDHIENHVVLVRSDGSVELLETELIEKGDPGCVIGRLPAGLCRRRIASGGNPVGRFFAKVATLEAAAVPAFEQLAGELALHRAPPELHRAALRARADEVRHARIMARIAHRYGGRPQVPELAPTQPRSLEAVALDNALEGCVRETYGALLAHVQSRRAATPRLRRTFARIARDETRHAALSQRLARWAATRLTPAERARVARSRASASEAMRVELTAGLDPRVHAVAGLPTPSEARGLFDGLMATLEA